MKRIFENPTVRIVCCVRTERRTHHDIRPRQLVPAEILAVVGRGGELGFQEVEGRFEIRIEESGSDAICDHEDEGAEEEGGAGFDVCRGGRG